MSHRSRFLKGALLAVAAASAPGPGAGAASAQAEPASKPNIIVFMADDVGWMNVSSYGGDIMGVRTPNIDRIGEEGMRLTSFYAQPSCTAGRAAFITGQLPVRTGLTTVGSPGSPAGLQAGDITLAEVLKSVGYSTAQFGKNHLGDLDEHLPCNHGFDVFYGNLYHLNANEDLEDPDRPKDAAFRKKFDPRGVVSCAAGGPVKDEGPLTVERMKTFDEDTLAMSIKYIADRGKDGKPFFLWHNPTRMHVFVHLKDDRKGVSRAGAQDIYGDGLAELDDQFGRMMAALQKSGLDRNTIVIFTTDNGAYQYMWPEGGTSPFRGDKGTTWEGGVRVPFLIRWPGAPGRRVSAEIVDMLDLMPTLASAAGVSDLAARLAKGASFNGKDYKVHLDGFDEGAFFGGEQETSNRKFVFYYDETVLTAIRYGFYKVTFSAKEGGKWDNPLLSLGRPLITNLLMDPFERQDGDVNRQLAEHKTWALTPIVGVATQHLATFKEFPIRQLGMSADVGKTVEGVQSQILKMQQQGN
ncbi:arylsulfatase [Methylocella sp.]|uniref:arylsulfatase n=1 Tax=Methylocella sp. TaxID=1978226 RepID=UPI0037836796